LAPAPRTMARATFRNEDARRRRLRRRRQSDGASLLHSSTAVRFCARLHAWSLWFALWSLELVVVARARMGRLPHAHASAPATRAPGRGHSRALPRAPAKRTAESRSARAERLPKRSACAVPTRERQSEERHADPAV